MSSQNEQWPGKWCGSCSQRWRRNGNPSTQTRLYKATLEDRFWFHVAPADPVTGCREWQASKNKKGYGTFRFSDERRSMGAHRVALILTEGREIEGTDVLHSCDTPACVEPTHLRWGTNGENMADRLEREGYVTCKRLTEREVVQIKDLLAGTKFSMAAIGRMYGVTRATVRNIKTGRNWGYV